MKRTQLAALILIASSVASAHNVWIRPSSTQLSGEKDYITIDDGASDFPFDVNHRGRPAENLHAYAPDGKEIEKENLMTGKLRTSYDAKLTQQGTHRFTDELRYIQFNYDDNGKSVRWRGTPEKYQKENPNLGRRQRCAFFPSFRNYLNGPNHPSAIIVSNPKVNLLITYCFGDGWIFPITIV